MWNGVIEPHSTQVVNVKLQTEILGPVRTNFVVKLDGQSMAVMMLILASSGGPDVKLDKQELDFGQVEVLADKRQTFKITNVGQIDAEYTAFTKNKDSIWKVIERYGVIKAKEEKTITVSCIADEVQRFQDTLHIIVNNGMDVEVQLKAKGVGNTLYTKVPMTNIDFGTEYTYKTVPRQYFLENRGRKPMKIMWVRQNVKQKKKTGDAAGAKSTTTDAAALMKRTGSISGENAKEEEQFVFSVVPDQITLGPKMGIMVEVRAYSHHIGQLSEPWECQVLIGSERKPRVAIKSNITANFITPSLFFNNPKLEFKYEWEKGIPAQAKIEELTIKNTGPLKTTLGLKIEPPFSCSVETLTLEKDAEDTVRVEFDPSSKQDRVSDTINGKLVISHEGHPHKDIVPLSGQVCFPNLQILPPKIDFGCILNDTGKKKYLVLTNVSEMAVAYEWSFLEDAPNIDEQEEIDADNVGKRKKKKKKHLPINEVFDILPVSGILQPGQTENVEFTFYAGNGLAYNGMAVVSVDGGPDYDVPISGESNNVAFRLSTNNLDFGEVAYNESQPRDFYIENVGKVPFEFNINLSTLSRQGVIECSHMTGKVLA
jgi:hydrocephalus-inducing protein